MANTRLAGLVLAATTLLTTGCGGTSTKSSPMAKASTGAQQATSTSPTEARTTPLTRNEFIAKANAICVRLRAQSATIRVKTPQDIARTAPQLLAYENTAFTELRQLTPPKEITGDWKAILADYQALIKEVEARGRYAKNNDSASIARLDKNIGRIQRHRILIAAHNHITGCSTI